MNPHLCRIVLRPRGPLEVLDLAFLLLRTHRAPFLALTAWTVLPATTLLAVSCWFTGGSPVLAVAPCLLAPLVHAPATMLAGRLLFDDRTTLRGAVGELGTRIVPLVFAWGQLAITAVVSVGTCGMVGVLSPAVAFVTEAVLLERTGASRALRRSIRLSAHAVGQSVFAVGGWIGLTLWGGVVGEAAGQGIVSFVLQLGEPFGALTDGRATPWLLAGMLAVQPIYAVWRLLLYVDARTRAEGWDLQVGLRAAGLSAARS